MLKNGRHPRIEWQKVVGLWLLLTIMLPLPVGYAQAEKQQVLVLSSYHQGFHWTDQVVAGFSSILKAESADIEFYFEYLDEKRFSSPDDYADRYDLYVKKYRDTPFDVIVVLDEGAFEFLLQYHDALFPRVPVIFGGVTAFDETRLIGYESVFSGIVLDAAIEETLDFALELHPTVQQLYVISDASVTGQFFERQFKALEAQYLDRGLSIAYDLAPDIPQILPDLRSAGDEALVFLLAFEENVTAVYDNPKVPVYGVWEAQLVEGMIGGKLTLGVTHGEALARRTLSFLRQNQVFGSRVVQDRSSHFVFDDRALTSFGIKRGQLPPNSEIVGGPVNFYTRNQDSIGLFLFFGLIIAGLVVAGFVTQGVKYQKLSQVADGLRGQNRELQSLQTSLEERVFTRTRDLARRSEHLALASEVSRDISSIRDLDKLLRTIVSLISSRFGYYHAGIFLTDKTGRTAVLVATSSEGGQRMLAREHRLQKGIGIVGTVLLTSEARIASNVGVDAVWFNNPDLPDTRSEMALPLLSRGQVIGVLDVQSVEADAFVEEDIYVLQTMAEQVAVAIDNARLFAELQSALEAERFAIGQVGEEAWATMFRSRVIQGYVSNEYGVSPVTDVTASISDPDVASSEPLAALSLPIKARDQVVGTFQARKPIGGVWSSEEKLLLENLMDQLGVAMEGARLYQATQRRESRERTIREISDRMQQATDLEALTRITAEEVKRLLGGSHVYVRMGAAESDTAADDSHVEGDD